MKVEESFTLHAVHDLLAYIYRRDLLSEVSTGWKDVTQEITWAVLWRVKLKGCSGTTSLFRERSRDRSILLYSWAYGYIH